MNCDFLLITKHQPVNIQRMSTYLNTFLGTITHPTYIRRKSSSHLSKGICDRFLEGVFINDIHFRFASIHLTSSKLHQNQGQATRFAVHPGVVDSLTTLKWGLKDEETSEVSNVKRVIQYHSQNRYHLKWCDYSVWWTNKKIVDNSSRLVGEQTNQRDSKTNTLAHKIRCSFQNFPCNFNHHWFISGGRSCHFLLFLVEVSLSHPEVPVAFCRPGQGRSQLLVMCSGWSFLA